MGKANHLRPIHTGGTTSITTVGQTAENMASHLDRQWPQDWRNNGREPGALCTTSRPKPLTCGDARRWLTCA